ncbi:DTW domain protein [Marinomonas gallaica]|uniref:tRNA-uridine aminocarboxypropyltransferase n=2 Tax=Marinomonas gallaica TaxID=1806667 RepID=A0A1C3JVC1_9GAMM|nr:DTW domain-containing protein [Marinomonas gallaica]SBT19087.1 DTW domain protein [Marinomonas gallaica]SBT20838.1 DTW domain protein [Marinomonas gallaica]
MNTMTRNRTHLSPRKHPLHCVDQLREAAKQNSQRAFIARGANAERCPCCLMASFACFCDQRTPHTSPINFTLLFHYTEIHKPTNSGRLIADLFPEQTKAFIWSRTTPDQELLDHLDLFRGKSIILFPDTEKRTALNKDLERPTSLETPINVIILDATWRLASKMLHQSRWLDDIPIFAVSDDAQRSFKVRHAKHDNQFATAEVVAMLLAQANAETQSTALANYYRVFNDHSMWSRRRHNSPT